MAYKSTQVRNQGRTATGPKRKKKAPFTPAGHKKALTEIETLKNILQKKLKLLLKSMIQRKKVREKLLKNLGKKYIKRM